MAGHKLTTHAVKLEHTIVVMWAARHTKKGETEEEEEEEEEKMAQTS